MLPPWYFSQDSYDFLFLALRAGKTVESDPNKLPLKLVPVNSGRFEVHLRWKEGDGWKDVTLGETFPKDIFGLSDAIEQALERLEQEGVVSHVKVAYEDGTLVFKDGEFRFTAKTAFKVLEAAQEQDMSREAIYLMPYLSQNAR